MTVKSWLALSDSYVVNASNFLISLTPSNCLILFSSLSLKGLDQSLSTDGA